MYSVYRLLDPRDLQIRYVGISKNVQQRFYAHSLGRQGNPQKDAWVQELKEISFAPVLEILATGLTCQEAQTQERQLIYHYHKLGFPLTNRDGISRKSTNRGMAGGRKGKRPLKVTALEKHFTPEQTAIKIHRTADTVRLLLRTNKLRGRLIGDKWRITESAILEYLNLKGKEK